MLGGAVFLFTQDRFWSQYTRFSVEGAVSQGVKPWSPITLTSTNVSIPMTHYLEHNNRSCLKQLKSWRNGQGKTKQKKTPNACHNTKNKTKYSAGGKVLISCRSLQTIAIRPSRPYYAGTEHVGFSPTRQTSRAPSTKRREVFGESHEG